MAIATQCIHFFHYPNPPVIILSIIIVNGTRPSVSMYPSLYYDCYFISSAICTVRRSFWVIFRAFNRHLDFRTVIGAMERARTYQDRGHSASCRRSILRAGGT